ncbi:hypothetical protein [Pseudoalteromonas sp. S16_S37]|uniref:hypothetical protein n=1 Tax=Pseudoalteromonas sp. S16_S37 TaxID=2720228 RepID=UPI00168144E6|nr:hypothetical protein [Pseudoalteromonas sp. S16_S37]MBD1583918.1 hypothetical protein [Pseudoalteromonas sp. S16_S37]
MSKTTKTVISAFLACSFGLAPISMSFAQSNIGIGIGIGIDIVIDIDIFSCSSFPECKPPAIKNDKKDILNSLNNNGE